MNFITLLAVLLLVTLVLKYLLQRLWRKIRVHWEPRILLLTKTIPGPPKIPILGNIHQFVGTPEHIWDTHEKFSKQYPRYQLWGLNQCHVFLHRAEDIEPLLTSYKNLKKGESYTHLENWLGNGLLISSGEKWKFRRKLLTPAFHFSILKNFVETFNKYNKYSFEKLLDGKEIEVISFSSEHALNTLCDTTMGVIVDDKSSDFREYKQAVKEFGKTYTKRILNPLLYNDFIYFNLSFAGKECRRITEILHKFSTKIIHERIDNWNEENIQGVECSTGKSKLPMMGLLIKQMKDGADIDYRGIREEVDTFMFEGHDTTSIGLSFLLMLLANNPDIQNRLLEEQIQVLGDLERSPTYEDLQNMDYLERCIKEALRLYPPVPFIARKLDEDLNLSDQIIPAGLYVCIMIYQVHHNAKYWPNPERYDPDRFLPENLVNHYPFAYIPFSAGSRNCIGQRFAILEMKSFISQLIREYILESVDTPDTIKLQFDLVLRVKNGIRVRFRKRNLCI